MALHSEVETKETTMRFLSIYGHAETGLPPTPEEMARIGKLIEEWTRAGHLLGAEGYLPSVNGAMERG
jgi:hypothetical protein